MALFSFGKKKEEINESCNCGGACDPKSTAKEESGCCCGGNCNSETMAAAEEAKTEGASIKVLGSGCAKCNQLEAAAKAALEQLGMDTTIDHVTDFSQIAAYGVMTTPALVVDGKVVSYGKVLKKEEVVKILQKVRS
ncbi:MAG: thioredoxin family protein [Candidatus Metalachnospira sp.]|nr:thioredoxin family protein [Candidatus Metalachnospira sp.]